MVSGEYEKIFRRICIDEIDILRDRIGGSAVDIEVYIRFFARRKYIDAAVFRVQSPAASGCDVAVQKNGFVLCQYADNIDSAIGAVTERKVDDAVFSPI